MDEEEDLEMQEIGLIDIIIIEIRDLIINKDNMDLDLEEEGLDHEEEIGIKGGENLGLLKLN
jgi:hypothetical protein